MAAPRRTANGKFIKTTPVTTNWRDTLTPDELVVVNRAFEYTAFWRGVPNVSPYILVAKLANLLDEAFKV